MTSTNGFVISAGVDVETMVEQIRSGEYFHEPLRSLSARFAANRMSEPDIVSSLQAYMASSSEKGTARWQERYDEIPRLVESAVEKFGKPTAVQVTLAELPPVTVVRPASHFTMPDGLAGEIAQYCMDTAPVPNLPYALMAGLLTISLLSRNRYLVPPFNTRLNLYVAAVGETSCGKDAPPQMVGSMARMVGIGNSVTEGVSSGVALQRALSEVPDHALFYWQDEIWEMLQAADSFKGSGYKKELTAALMTLYGRAGSSYQGRKYADAKNNIEPIQNPYMIFGGATTPARFMEALSQKYVADGFLNRLIVFQSDGVPPQVPPTGEILPPTLKQQLTQLYDPSFTEIPIHRTGVLIRREPGVDERLTDFGQECRAMLTSNPDLGALWSRGFENSVKVAGIQAVGTDREHPVITLNQADWAINLVSHCLESFGLQLEQHMFEGEFDKQCKNALEYIRNPLKYTGDKRWGDFCARGVMPRGLLTKRLRNVRSMGISEIIKKLLESGEIVEIQVDENTAYVVYGSVPHV
jgi:hypothetical protein